MESVYIDIHIHTSENPDCLKLDYDVDTLFKNIRQSSQGQNALISFTDHNTINKQVYLDALPKCGNDIHLLLGVELHIHYVKTTQAYHCHMLFKNDITADEIDKINAILDKLYPNKVVEKKDESIPTIEELINEFDSYDFVLLPHGGQTHATFDKAIPADRRFDTMMERSVYYNQFDGFTARSESGRDETDQYFKRLGISGFVNLITCSDNYTPARYPEAKDSKAEPLIPTWMYASPTFEGLRLSLSEKSRLVYQMQKPELWAAYIEQVKYSNDKIDIDVNFSSGLNVVIGGSSSGKTLLVDSIWRKLSHDNFEDSYYNAFEVSNINVTNSSGIQPHYLSQNYIMQVVGDSEEHQIEDIDIIRSIFPDNTEVLTIVEAGLATLKKDISQLIQTVKSIESIESKLKKTLQIGQLLVLRAVKKNLFDTFLPKEDVRDVIHYSKAKKDKHIETLTEIKAFIDRNPLTKAPTDSIDELMNLLNSLFKYSELEDSVYDVIRYATDNYAAELKAENQEEQTKTQEFEGLIDNIIQYVYLNNKFKKHLNSIANYKVKIDTKEIVSAGHHLFISNQFKMDKNTVLEVFNNLLKTGNKIDNFGSIQPHNLFESNFSKKNPKVQDYDDFSRRVYDDFSKQNKTVYKIRTKDDKDFENLSAGWKTSVLLDLILGYDKDIAPIIIDQPEDNLATKYINDGLVESIKKVKTQKQIIYNASRSLNHR